MGIFSIIAKGDDLVGEYTLPLRKAYNLKYIKLLHLHTNLNSTHFKGASKTGDTRASERLMFVKFNFLHSENYDNFNESNSYVSLGASGHSSTAEKIISKDLFKVLLDKPVIQLQGDIKIRLYFLDCDGEIKPLESGDVISTISGKETEISFVNLILEYEEI